MSPVTGKYPGELSSPRKHSSVLGNKLFSFLVHPQLLLTQASFRWTLGYLSSDWPSGHSGEEGMDLQEVPFSRESVGPQTVLWDRRSRGFSPDMQCKAHLSSRLTPSLKPVCTGLRLSQQNSLCIYFAKLLVFLLVSQSSAAFSCRVRVC